MRRLFMVDFQENGIDKHQAIELQKAGGLDRWTVVMLLKGYLGKNCTINTIIEVFGGITRDELARIAQTPEVAKYPWKILYINPKAFKESEVHNNEQSIQAE